MAGIPQSDLSEDSSDEEPEGVKSICAKQGHFYGQGETDSHCNTCGEKKPGGTSDDDAEEDLLVWDDDGDVKAPTKFNLIQLVANDINTNVVAIPIALCRLLVMFPICLILFAMLWSKIKITLLLCVGACIVMGYGIWRAAGSQIGWMMAFYFYSGKRLMFVEDLLFNIRTVKAFGWEGIMEERIFQLRGLELEVLWGFYKRLGLFFGIFYQFPRVMILLGLWGFTWLYGAERPVNIFATLPILFTLQSAIINIMMAMPILINARPSIFRIEQFMRLPEAPFPREESPPAWVDTWPDAEAKKYRAGQLYEQPRVASGLSLQIQGSFMWRGQNDAALKDLNLSVPAGTSIAVLGKVGSGKSSLLQALVGELYPVGDARICIPFQVAYSSQTPYICEGTLKENILYGEPYDENRYNTCVFAASLFPDIQVLPGGDEVPIGSRGISLSGGQRARVSLARAAYCATADAVLIDDPFGSVDSRTARHLLDEYVHGAALKGRTRVVVCQPDPERIQDFDKVIIMHKGRIVVEGTPREAMQTSSFRNLLNHHQKNSLEQGPERPEKKETTVRHSFKKTGTDAFVLREEEYENRPDWQTVNYFLNIGGRSYIFGCVFLFLVMIIFNLMMGIVLQNWASDAALAKAGMLYPIPPPTTYLYPYLAWWVGAILVWVVCWWCGMQFTINLSRTANMTTMKAILHAPVDRFFDRTPVGRIMNRMSTDLSNIDTATFNHVTQLISAVWTNVVPLVYLHVLMPVYFSCASIPFYYLMFLLVKRFWNTMVPMRYLVHISKSHTDTTLTEVDNSNSFVRACRKGEFRFQEFQKMMKSLIKADTFTQTFLKRWLVNRLFLMMGFFVCCMVILSIWVPNAMAIGGIGLCLANMFQMIVTIEQDIDTTMKAQFQLISMKRLHDYTMLEQEADYEKETDTPYKNYCIKVKRAKLGTLKVQAGVGQKVMIVRKRNGYDQPLLEATGKGMFSAPEGFQVFDPSNPDLLNCRNKHQVVSVNGKRHDVAAMAEELCNGKSVEVVLQIQSGWLLTGAHLVIKDLVAGYGDVVQNVLKGVSMDILPRSKVAVVGTTGCGKSTLLLCILRILERRKSQGGQILLNDVDIATLGLKTLRTTIGMVPQDPVLMQCSVRDNLDPFGEFDDDILWKGLAMVQMKEHIGGLAGGLSFEIQADGGNLSYGQRQLLCMARMVIRQPALILLDEATSALDPATQQQVQHTVMEHFPDSTQIMIAHRLETVASFDKVIVMDKGKIVEHGAPAELQQVKDGFFAKMWAAKQTW